MNARRRGGKPNRGGGRFNKPRGGSGGGGGSRKGGGAGCWDDDDDFSLDFGPSRSSRPGKVRGGGGRPRGRDAGRGRGFNDPSRYDRGEAKSDRKPFPRSLVSTRIPPKLGDGNRLEASSMPLQRIFMTNENQEQLKELLRELQTQDFDEPYEESGSDYSEGEEEEYDELDHREEGQFWVTNDEPVEQAESPAYNPEEEEEDEEDERPTPEPVISLFAIGKLCRYGFDRERSKQALESGGGEFGVTLEQLLLQVFSERYGQKAVSPDDLQGLPMDECLSQRQEEALALAAIYGERFNERIANAVWTVSLDLPFLSDKPFKNRGEAVGKTSRELCKFYLKDRGCRFGDRCRFRHELPGSERSGAGSSDLKGPSLPGFSSYSPPEYELEVRFPKQNRYPHQAPIVAFSTNDESVGAGGRLSVTEKLFGEALAAAKSAEPVVYTLITFCEDELSMKELLAISHHKYSTPPPVVVPQPTSLSIAKSKSGRSSTSEESKSSSTNSRRAAPPTNQKPTDLKETGEAEEPEEEVEVVVVPVETESYVNLRKKMESKHSQKVENLLQDNSKLCREFQRKQSSRRFKSMLEQRRSLPAWQEKDNILDELNSCQVLVVSGMTGCGKTTQIPQFILDASLCGPAGQVANIICTQPRRISAMSVAQRVAQERAECLGHTVGYQIRLETVRTSATRLLYCTTGVLLRRLEGEADLRGVTHVFVDEVHERTEESDFLLLVLKDLITKREDLKIILMSATLNANLFSEYFYNCPTIHIPGRTFPVDQFFLEDAIAKTGYVIEDGSPFMRSGKQNPSSTSGRGGKSDLRDMVDDLGDDVWNFMSFCKKDFVKDSIPDQQLSLQELTVRYKDTKKSVLKTIAAMDLDKINMDLVESLLEWIVDGKHNYPPGAVLVFMPGLAEIKLLYEQLQSNRIFNNRRASSSSNYTNRVTPVTHRMTTEAIYMPTSPEALFLQNLLAETRILSDRESLALIQDS
ncbi:hypothetical protein CRENBAI_007306 [Crenichthys baileyi]|uniref:RNA helicase n=1 Tax=Crenichthys baileyi TaxID=28760 RepID=A0AAV9RDT5_9TELE